MCPFFSSEKSGSDSANRVSASLRSAFASLTLSAASSSLAESFPTSIPAKPLTWIRSSIGKEARERSKFSTFWRIWSRSAGSTAADSSTTGSASAGSGRPLAVSESSSGAFPPAAPAPAVSVWVSPSPGFCSDWTLPAASSRTPSLDRPSFSTEAAASRRAERGTSPCW